MGFSHEQKLAIEAFRDKNKTHESGEVMPPEEKKLTPEQVKLLKSKGAAMEAALSHTLV